MFGRIISGINRCGWLIIELFMFSFLAYYGWKHHNTIDLVGGSFFSGVMCTVIFEEVCDYVMSHDDDED